MGFNTVVVVLNDALDVGAGDPELGSRIERAAHAWPVREHRRGALDLMASNERCSSSYGEVISQAHADEYQVTVTHANMGWRIDRSDYDQYLGGQALRQMKECLERNGYEVRGPA